MIVIINFKTYKQGKDVVKLAKAIEKVDKKIIIGVQASDVYEVVRGVGLRVFVQHVDGVEPGRNTGYIIPEAVKADGAKGVFLNHSEHPLKIDVLRATIKRCREVGLKTVVFFEGLVEGRKIEKLKPDYLIYEPASLVGGNVSVSKSKPEVIEEIVKGVKVSVLVGAGIKSNEDVKIAMKLGAKGIAVSSGVVKSKNPEKVLRGLIG